RRLLARRLRKTLLSVCRYSSWVGLTPMERANSRKRSTAMSCMPPMERLLFPPLPPLNFAIRSIEMQKAYRLGYGIACRLRDVYQTIQRAETAIATIRRWDRLLLCVDFDNV